MYSPASLTCLRTSDCIFLLKDTHEAGPVAMLTYAILIKKRPCALCVCNLSLTLKALNRLNSVKAFHEDSIIILIFLKENHLLHGFPPKEYFFFFAPFYRFHWDKCYLYPMKKDGLSFKKKKKKKVNELSWFIFKQVIFHTLACLEQSLDCPKLHPGFPR